MNNEKIKQLWVCNHCRESFPYPPAVCNECGYADFVINPVSEEGEKNNGLWGSSSLEDQRDIWNDIDNNYHIWQDQEMKIEDLLRDFEIKRR